MNEATARKCKACESENLGLAKSTVRVNQGAPSVTAERQAELVVRVLHVLSGEFGIELDWLFVVIDELQRNRRMEPNEGAGYGSTGLVGIPKIEPFPFPEPMLDSDLQVKQVVIGSDQAVRTARIDELSHNSSPSVDDAGAHSVGDGLVAGDASTTPATEVTDPHISARYDAPLNAIAMSVGGTDDLYFDRDATFLLVDELLTALRDQAKNGGLA